MKDLKLDKLAMLARTCAVHRVFITPYPATDGGGWWLDIDHKDPKVGRKLMTQRGGLRVFKSVDQALAILRECGYLGSVMVLPESEAKPERAAAPVAGQTQVDGPESGNITRTITVDTYPESGTPRRTITVEVLPVPQVEKRFYVTEREADDPTAAKRLYVTALEANDPPAKLKQT